MCNPFELFQLPEIFDIDEISLEKQYVAFCKENHPDRFVSSAEKMVASKKMETINSAYKVLSSKLFRAEYLMKLTSVNPSQEVVDWTFSIVDNEISDAELKLLINSCVNNFSSFFKNVNYRSASDELFKWKFLAKLSNVEKAR